MHSFSGELGDDGNSAGERAHVHRRECFFAQKNGLASIRNQGGLKRPVLLGRQPQVDPTSPPLDSVLQHFRLSESPNASPRLANSRIFSGSAKVNFRGSGVFRSASGITSSEGLFRVLRPIFRSGALTHLPSSHRQIAGRWRPHAPQTRELSAQMLRRWS
jgi:hypothetical protein